MIEWKPIATVKEGAVVKLAWIVAGNVEYKAVGKWVGGKDRLAKAIMPETGYFTEPTHWMPLPPPPEEKK